jgi:hypothetical protein
MGQFLPLFSIEVEHSYFAGGVCTALQLAPSAKASELLSRARCLVRPTASGVTVACDSAAIPILRDACRDVDDPLRVEFFARTRDDQFANYTDAGTVAADSLLHFDSDAATFNGSDQRWRLAATRRAHALPGRELNSKRQVMNAVQRLPAPAFSIAITVTAADVDAVDRGCKSYICALAARETIWKYYLFGEWAEVAEDLLVVDLGQSFQFEAAVAEQLSNGQLACVVRSAGKIPLRNRSDQRFQLRLRNGSTDKVLVKRLPVPSATGLSRDFVAGAPTLVSEIYVHR